MLDVSQHPVRCDELAPTLGGWSAGHRTTLSKSHRPHASNEQLHIDTARTVLRTLNLPKDSPFDAHSSASPPAPWNPPALPRQPPCRLRQPHPAPTRTTAGCRAGAATLSEYPNTVMPSEVLVVGRTECSEFGRCRRRWHRRSRCALGTHARVSRCPLGCPRAPRLFHCGAKYSVVQAITVLVARVRHHSYSAWSSRCRVRDHALVGVEQVVCEGVDRLTPAAGGRSGADSPDLTDSGRRRS